MKHGKAIVETSSLQCELHSGGIHTNGCASYVGIAQDVHQPDG